MAQGERFALDILHHIIKVVVVPRTHLYVERRKHPYFFFTLIHQQLVQFGTTDELAEKKGELGVREESPEETSGGPAGGTGESCLLKEFSVRVCQPVSYEAVFLLLTVLLWNNIRVNLHYSSYDIEPPLHYVVTTTFILLAVTQFLLYCAIENLKERVFAGFSLVFCLLQMQTPVFKQTTHRILPDDYSADTLKFCLKDRKVLILKLENALQIPFIGRFIFINLVIEFRQQEVQLTISYFSLSILSFFSFYPLAYRQIIFPLSLLLLFFLRKGCFSWVVFRELVARLSFIVRKIYHLVSFHLLFFYLPKILKKYPKVVRLRPRRTLDFSEFSVSELCLGDSSSRPRFFLQFKDWLECLALPP